jgi:uncharacterized spore protein YtfJ
MAGVHDMLKGARDAIAVKRVFGKPVERDGVTVIPAAAVRGGGGGGGDAEGAGGGGFGLQARPVGAYEIRNGQVRWVPATDPARALLGWQIVAALTMLVAWSIGRRLASR